MTNKKLWLRFIQILLTRVPVISFAGFTVISFIIGWALDFNSPLWSILPLVFLCLTGGTIGQIFFLSADKIARQVKEEFKKELSDSRERSLDELYCRLTQDNDPRTEASLKELREIAKAINESAGGESKLDHQTVFEVLFKVEELFNKCVNRLEKSLKLWGSAQKISNQQVKEHLMKLREDIITEVKNSIVYLGNILARIQSLNYNQIADRDDLSVIMKDLDEGISIAEKVDERMRKLEKGE